MQIIFVERMNDLFGYYTSVYSEGYSSQKLTNHVTSSYWIGYKL